MHIELVVQIHPGAKIRATSREENRAGRMVVLCAIEGVQQPVAMLDVEGVSAVGSVYSDFEYGHFDLSIECFRFEDGRAVGSCRNGDTRVILGNS